MKDLEEDLYVEGKFDPEDDDFETLYDESNDDDDEKFNELNFS